MSYEPAEDGGHDPQRQSARPGSNRWPLPGGFIEAQQQMRPFAFQTTPARTGDPRAPEAPRYLLRHHPMNLMGCSLARRNRTSSLVLPKHVPYHSAIASRLAGGPPRIRTGNLLLAGESLFHLELAAHRLPAPRRRAARSGLRGHVCLVREAACLFLWCSAMHLSTNKHVHPARWCSAWTAGIEPATTGFGDQRSP